MDTRSSKKPLLGINTRLAHDGYDPGEYHGFVNPPVVHASTVLFPDAATMANRNQKYTYGTRGTPTTDALCDAVNALEGSAGTILVPSGLAAVTVPLLSFLSSGDHVLIVDSVYNPTRHFADTMLTRLGIEVEYYDPLIGAGIQKLIRANTKVVFTESPGSNTFEIQDIPAIVEKAHDAGAIVMMDNTWATPVYLKPLDFGVDLVIHSGTKFIGGHSDLMIGLAVTRDDAVHEALRHTRLVNGATPGALEAFLALRGVRTLPLRMERAQSNAEVLVARLRAHPAVEEVRYPGTGAMVSFVVRGGE